MDQDSSNDSEKRNWRERLGIGTKEMPKIAGEFAKPAEPVLVTPRAKIDPAQPVVVAKPAPMAPRVAGKPTPVAKSAADRAGKSSQGGAAAVGRPMQPAAPQNPEVLAERLRNQREAAEKLAEQRVSNAKERAEAVRTAQQQPVTAPSPVARSAAEAGGAKPKFSFAEDDARSDAKREPRSMPPMRGAAPQQRPPLQSQPMQPQLSPARPQLGGDRFVTPQVPPPTRQAAPPAAMPAGMPPPQYRPQAPGGYRPIDPATGYAPPPSFQMPRGTMAPPPGPRPAAVPGSRAGDPRLQGGPYMGGEATYVPPPMQQGGIPRYDQLPRQQAPLRNDQLRPQTHSYEGDLGDDIFEDTPTKPVRRANVNDYSQAYHQDGEFDYAAPRRRSTGPIILLSFLAVAALAGIGSVFYYQNYMKSGTSSSAEGTPVVEAPADAAKTSGEQTAAVQPGSTPVQPSKKQIYDRIIGDKEVLGGQVVPTEEAPVQPAVDQAGQPVPVPAPAAGASDEPLPLPMPPPVNNTQGAAPAAIPQTTTAAAAVPEPPVAPADSTTVTATGYTAEQQQQLAAASQQKTTLEDTAAVDDQSQQAEAVSEPPPAASKPATKPKVAAKPKLKKKVETAAKPKLGDEPVVLVPQEEQAAGTPLDQAVTVDGEPPLQAATPVEQPVKKKKTLLGLFNGDNKKVGEEPVAETVEGSQQPQQKRQQVAAVETQRKAEPAPAPSAGGTGFTLQLASFASEQEARAEYQRVSSRHSSIVNGLSPTVTPVSVGGSTRYRLSLGTVSSSTQAQNLCKDLASAGLRDCVVRRR